MAGNKKPSRKKVTKVRTQGVPAIAANAAANMIARESAKHQATISNTMQGILDDPNLSNEQREKLLAELYEMKGQSITPLASDLTASLMKKVNK